MDVIENLVPHFPNKREVIFEDDDVLHEIDVFINNNLDESLYILQFLMKPVHDVPDSHGKFETKFKKKLCKIHMQCELDTQKVTYDKSRGEQFAINCNPLRSTDGLFQRNMDYQILESVNTGGMYTGCYTVGLFKNNALYLNSVKEILQMRPNFTYLNVADEMLKNTSKVAKDENLENISHDESDNESTNTTQIVRIKFTGGESEASKKRRLSSYSHMQKSLDDERWIPLSFSGALSCQSACLRNAMTFDGKYDNRAVIPVLTAGVKQLMRLFIPKAEDDVCRDVVPDDKISLAQIRTLPLSDQIQALMMNVKAIHLKQLCALLPDDTDESTVLKGLHNCAALVHGNWVVRSELLYPRHAVSAKSGSTGEALCRARDLCLYKFCQNVELERKEVAGVVRIPNEDLQDILRDVATYRSQHKSWLFAHPPDADFMARHADIVQRQAIFWDAKYQALCHQLNIKRGQSSPTRPRCRTGSRNASQSACNLDGEKLAASASDCAAAGLAGTENLDEGLRRFLYERLSAKPALRLSELKRLLLLKLAESAPGSALGAGVNERQLEQCARQIGALRVQTQTMREPVLLFTQLSSWPDVRQALVRALLARPHQRCKLSALRKACAQALPNADLPDDATFRRIVFDYCAQKNSSVQLIGCD